MVTPAVRGAPRLLRRPPNCSRAAMPVLPFPWLPCSCCRSRAAVPVPCLTLPCLMLLPALLETALLGPCLALPVSCRLVSPGAMYCQWDGLSERVGERSGWASVCAWHACVTCSVWWASVIDGGAEMTGHGW